MTEPQMILPDGPTYLPGSYTDAQFDKILREQTTRQVELAKVAAQRDLDLANVNYRERAARRSFLGQMLVGAAFLAFFLAIIFSLLFATSDSEADKERKTEIAKICIQEGKSWVNDQCLKED